MPDAESIGGHSLSMLPQFEEHPGSVDDSWLELLDQGGRDMAIRDGDLHHDEASKQPTQDQRSSICHDPLLS